MTVTSATPTTSLAATSPAASLDARLAARGGEQNISSDRFLKLLVTQMQNQDPLNPMDNAQVTTQLAQISTVSGVDKLNTSINQIGRAHV